MGTITKEKHADDGEATETILKPEVEWFVAVLPDGENRVERAVASAREAGFMGEYKYVHDLTKVKGEPEEQIVIRDAKARGYTLTSGSFSLVFSRPKI